jgi:hypothetical protein
MTYRINALKPLESRPFPPDRELKELLGNLVFHQVKLWDALEEAEEKLGLNRELLEQWMWGAAFGADEDGIIDEKDVVWFAEDFCEVDKRTTA